MPAQWLFQPYPLEKRLHSELRVGFWAGLFVAFFLFFFRPFGTAYSGEDGWYFSSVCAAFGLVTFVVTILVNVFCRLFPRIFKEEKWVIWKEILFNLFFIACIGMGNLLLAKILWNVPFTGHNILRFQAFTLGIGLFPILFGAFLTQMRLQKKYFAEAAAIHPHPKVASENTPQDILLTGENQYENMPVLADHLAYLTAQDNYVQVFYWEEGVLKNRLFRSTLRKMEDLLAAWPQFCRCHRTFLVNFDMVERVSGNAQGYRLHLKGVEESIPVSRNLNRTVRERLEH